MATVRVYIRKRPSKDGKFPISICITISRKQEYIMTGQKLDSLSHWDEKAQRVKKSHPNATRLNNFLLTELAKANDKALEMETKGYVARLVFSAKSITAVTRHWPLRSMTSEKRYVFKGRRRRYLQLSSGRDLQNFKSDH
ncbi:Arm DNA-binding domain-containing protein [Mucilaginibacter sp. AW1-3]